MDRFGLFIDAGYLYAAAGNLCLGTVNRSLIHIESEALHEALVALAIDEYKHEHLRTYWYDGARDAQWHPSTIRAVLASA
jgi:hypothetical protein